MRFALLGPLEVTTSDGRGVAVGEPKVRALLAALLVPAGRPVPVHRLVADVWPDEQPGNPTNTLQTKVSQLRRVLEAAEPGARGLVTLGPGGYALAVGADDVDTGRFRALLARAGAEPEPAARVGLLTDALALWRGPALAEFADAPFAVDAARRLDAERLAAEEDRAEARLALGQHHQLVAELDQLAARHPTRERLGAARATALYRAGRQAEALDVLDRLRADLAEAHGLDPGPELAALRQAILVRDPALAAPGAGPVRLPAPLTEPIGRAGEIEQVRGLLAEHRVVTLTGPGGVGKTTLAVAAARGLADRFPDGIWLVELAELGAGETVEALGMAVAATLGLRDTACGGSLDRVAGCLADQRALLVLDNCEHVIDAAAELAALVGALGEPRVLVTSREPLRLTGERVFPVPALAPGDAAELFAARASAADPGWVAGAAQARTVTAICARLDGVPLAIELAAARVRALGLPELLNRLDDRFGLLTDGARDRPDRQRTLRAVIDWSWRLLTPAQRAVLRRLAVHQGGCTLEAAERVCAGGEVSAGEVLGLLVQLVDRSLVVAAMDPATGAHRYRLLESVAAYGLERLVEAGEQEKARGRHLEHYLNLARRGDRELRGPAQREWLARLDAERANLRRALDTAGRGDLAFQLVDALVWYWFLRGRLGEAERALHTVLEAPGGSAGARARARTWRAGFAVLGDPAARSEGAPWREIEDPAERAAARRFLLSARNTLGEVAAGDTALDELLAEFERLGDRWGVAAVLADRSHRAITRGALAGARRDAERADREFAELGDRWGQLQARSVLGSLAEVAGDYPEAGRVHADCLRLAEQLGLWPDVAYQLCWLGRIALLRGEPERAEKLHREAIEVAGRHGFVPGRMYAETGLALIARRRGRFAEARRHLERVREWHSRVEFEPGNALILAELGFLAEQGGDGEGARRLHLAGLDSARRGGDPRAVALALEGLAGVAALEPGQPGGAERAATLLGAAEAAREGAGAPLPVAERGDVDRITGRARETLGPARFAAGHRAGRTLGLAEAQALIGVTVGG
ncbi:BTAD domain-containing putative transcriptional regulator [Pseudonocardia eucalypti]|uniref:BTAD domain-containing putative transcriptional regulator n=1 Tax=Pseudonocardia eucalypti TaxID=648755 RepID=A0ABP9QVF4_9PSEU|nr:putative ATPase/DNA-binding winged helix-turn-helix (wHTH) protein [Pseudonocardia eucalypti]